MDLEIILIDAGFTCCQESRYRSKGPVTPTMKATPDLFIPLGDSPPPETYKEGLRCFACDSVLKFLPLPAASVKAMVGDSTLDRASLRELMVKEQETAARAARLAPPPPQEPLPAPISPKRLPTYQVSLFEAADGEVVNDIKEVGEMVFLVKTSKRLLIIDANQVLEAQ